MRGGFAYDYPQLMKSKSIIYHFHKAVLVDRILKHHVMSYKNRKEKKKKKKRKILHFSFKLTSQQEKTKTIFSVHSERCVGYKQTITVIIFQK